MPKPIVLVTGANGQLGRAIKTLSAGYPQFDGIFLTREDLSIDQEGAVHAYFAKKTPAFCINCAAYTAVDKAETEREQAMHINGEAPGILASACAKAGAKLIHISTDYVFDGTGSIPYKEDDNTNPVNFYGATKLEGENRCLQYNDESIIIRTAWVYAEYGNNFVRTMMRLMKERTSLNVVNDQWGSPTYAVDLAAVILSVVAGSIDGTAKWTPGIYHYSNEGIINWYDFAVAIKKLTGAACAVNPIPTSMYPTPARRPAYSVMDKQKIKSVFHTVIPQWENSLAVCIGRMQ